MVYFFYTFVFEMTTREKLIHTTAQLVWNQGYFGTGITEILLQSEVPKGSLYHHFPKGKDQLIVASISYSGDRMQKKYQDALRSKGAYEGLCAVIDTLKTEMENSNFKHGCPIATVALDVASHNEEIRTICKDMYTSWQDGLATYLESRGVSDPLQKSKLFFTMIEGAFVLAKAHHDLSFLELQKNYFKVILEA